MRRKTIVQKAWDLYRRHRQWALMALLVKALIGIAIMGYLLIEARMDIASITNCQTQMAAQQERVEQLVSAVAPLRAMQAMALRFERGTSPHNLNGSWTPKDASLVVATIYRCARGWNIDPLLVEAVIVVESGRCNLAKGAKGEGGLMQLMPCHLTDGEDPYDPVLNIEKGTAYLAQCIRRCRGDIRMGLYCYNGSPPRNPYPMSIEYAERVLAQWSRLRAL